MGARGSRNVRVGSRIAAITVVALAAALLTGPPQGRASDTEPQTVSSFSIDEPSEDVHLAGLPADFDSTFTTAASHVLGRYRAIIWLEGPERVDLAVRTIPLPITGWSPSGPVTQTESLTVPAGTPSGTYSLCIRAEENYPPGSESWGYSMTDCAQDVIHIGGAIEAVEFVQVTQEPQELEDLQEDGPSVPIVRDRPAVMRVYPAEVDDATELRIDASGDAQGSETHALSPGCTAEDARESARCASFDFPFEPGDSVDVTVAAFDEEGEEVDSHSFSFSTVETTPMRVRPVSVCDASERRSGWLPLRDWECAEAGDLGSLIGFTERTLPGEVELMSPGRQIRSETDTADADWWSGVLSALKRRWVLSLPPAPGDRYYYGMVRPEAGTSGIGGMATRPGHAGASRTSVVREGREVADETVAHELGHNLGRRHAPAEGSGFDHTSVGGCYNTPSGLDPSWPHGADPGIDEWGFDVDAGAVVDPDDHFDWMSYCVPRWVSPYTYTAVMEQLGADLSALSTPQSASDDGAWLVSGSIDGASVALDAVFEVERPATAEPGAGDYRIEVRGDVGDVRFTRAFDPEQLASEADAPSLFAELIPIDDGASTLAVVGPDGDTVTEVALGSATPQIDVSLADGFEVVDELRAVEWDVVDPDSTEHEFLLEYSRDGGQTWEVLALDQRESDYTLDPSDLPGSVEPGSSMVRVLASDGASTGSAVSDGFTVPSSGPSARITAPDDSHRVREGQVVWLRAVALDLEDGALDGDSVVWESDVDGELGRGPDLAVTTLSEGEHLVTLTATDSDGATASDSVTVRVDGTPPTLDVTVGGEPLPGPAGEVLVVRTASVSASIETSLLEIDVPFSSVLTSDFGSVDFGPYDTIVVGMDGGALGDDDALALREAMDAGKRVVAFGGAPTSTFAEAVAEHLVDVDTSETHWTRPASPHFELVDAAHPLARRLPESHDFTLLPDQTRSAADYMLRIIDEDAHVVARNGDGHPALVSVEDGALVWMVNTPWGALWGDPADTLMLDQLLSNALRTETIVSGPATVALDADDGGGSGVEWLDYSLDGGATWSDADVAALPHVFDLTEEAHIDLVVRVGDATGNRTVSSGRFFVEAPVDPLTKDGCKDGGWQAHGFPNQGQCVRFIETLKDPAPGH